MVIRRGEEDEPYFCLSACDLSELWGLELALSSLVVGPMVGPAPCHRWRS